MSGPAAVSERLARIVAAVLGVDEGRLSASDSPETLDAWDSIHHIQLIMAIEAEFDLQFSADEIGELNSIGRILERIGEGGDAS